MHRASFYKCTKLSKVNVRSNLFTNRVTRTWNSLPEVIVTAPSLSSFKSRLKQFDFNAFLNITFGRFVHKQHIVIWFIVSGGRYDALMLWYNQATPHCYFVLIACIHLVISFYFVGFIIPQL